MNSRTELEIKMIASTGACRTAPVHVHSNVLFAIAFGLLFNVSLKGPVIGKWGGVRDTDDLRTDGKLRNNNSD